MEILKPGRTVLGRTVAHGFRPSAWASGTTDQLARANRRGRACAPDVVTAPVGAPGWRGGPRSSSLWGDGGGGGSKCGNFWGFSDNGDGRGVVRAGGAQVVLKKGGKGGERKGVAAPVLTWCDGAVERGVRPEPGPRCCGTGSSSAGAGEWCNRGGRYGEMAGELARGKGKKKNGTGPRQQCHFLIIRKFSNGFELI
jgi:hypothetical protein